MVIFEVLLGSVNMTGMGPLVPVRRCPRMVHLPPMAAVMAPRSDASCWCISARSCIADISLRGQDLLDRTGDPSPRD
jgi:hypothetical protein